MEASYQKGKYDSENIIGPLRVVPGKLSVSRAFGDIEAKSPLFNGNPNVIIAKPDVKYFDINSNYDFVFIGCDGIFEGFKNKEILEVIWKNSQKEAYDIHNKCGILVESVISECIKRKLTDNLTCVLISFKDCLMSNELSERENTTKYRINTDFVKLKNNNPNSSENLLNNSNGKYNANSDEGKSSVLPMPKLKSLKELNFKMNNLLIESNDNKNFPKDTKKKEKEININNDNPSDKNPNKKMDLNFIKFFNNNKSNKPTANNTKEKFVAINSINSKDKINKLN